MRYKIIFGFCFLFVFINTYSQTEFPVRSDVVHTDSVTVQASFPGGEQGWITYLRKNLNSAIAAEKGAPAGYYRVMIRFVVTKDGSLSDVMALTKLGYGMEQEVMRIIKKSGNWVPAKVNDTVVNSLHTQPVTFVVTNDGLDIITKIPHKLFTGIENEIKIDVEKVKSEDLSATITNGRITPLKDGNFIVRVNDTTRRAVITVYNTKKGGKEIGAESFEVRPKQEAPDAKKE